MALRLPMIDFGKIIYLDVQKTGSSFIARFLKSALLEPPLKHIRHAAIKEDHRSSATYIISVRDPLAQYLSLFRYGLDQRGQLYTKLQRAGFGGLYADATMAGFEAWLTFFLNPRAAKHIDNQYTKTRPRLYGYQTFRFLRLSFQHPTGVLKTRSTRAALQARYNAQKLQTHVLRNEHLNQDLLALTRSELASHFRPANEINSYLVAAKRVNRSTAGADLDLSTLSPALRKRVKKREWFLYQNFYPDG